MHFDVFVHNLLYFPCPWLTDLTIFYPLCFWPKYFFVLYLFIYLVVVHVVIYLTWLALLWCWITHKYLKFSWFRCVCVLEISPCCFSSISANFYLQIISPFTLVYRCHVATGANVAEGTRPSQVMTSRISREEECTVITDVTSATSRRTLSATIWSKPSTAFTHLKSAAPVSDLLQMLSELDRVWW